MFTKPTTITSTEIITGKAETFIIETARHTELGDTIFIQSLDETGVTRIALPAKAANAIARQRDALTTRIRSRIGKENAEARKNRGELPGFMKGREVGA